MGSVGTRDQVGHEHIDAIHGAPKIHIEAPLPVLLGESPDGTRFAGTDSGVGKYQVHLREGLKRRVQKALQALS